MQASVWCAKREKQIVFGECSAMIGEFLVRTNSPHSIEIGHVVWVESRCGRCLGIFQLLEFSAKGQIDIFSFIGAALNGRMRRHSPFACEHWSHRVMIWHHRIDRAKWE